MFGCFRRHKKKATKGLRRANKEQQRRHPRSEPSATPSTHGNVATCSQAPSFSMLNERARIQARREKLPLEIAACLDWKGYLSVPVFPDRPGDEWNQNDAFSAEEYAHADELLRFVGTWSNTLMPVIQSERAPELTRFCYPQAEEHSRGDVLDVAHVLASNPVCYAVHEPEYAHYELPVMLDFVSRNLPTLLKAGLNTVYLDGSFNDALDTIKKEPPDHVRFFREQLHATRMQGPVSVDSLRQIHYVHFLKDLQRSGVRIVSLCDCAAWNTARAYADMNITQCVGLTRREKLAISRYVNTMATAYLLMDSVEIMDKMNQDFLIHPNTRALALVDALHFEDDPEHPACNLLKCWPAPVIEAPGGVVSVRTRIRDVIPPSPADDLANFSLRTVTANPSLELRGKRGAAVDGSQVMRG